jgi:hypothetical protein
MIVIKKRPSLKRYSAALLFQFRVMVDGVSGKRRLCEKRIIHFRARDGRSALAHAKKRGKEAEHHYKNNEGNPVFFEFVGVRDLLGCDPGCEPDEVWYQIVEMVRPMERRKQLIPPESQLCAIRNDE